MVGSVKGRHAGMIHVMRFMPSIPVALWLKPIRMVQVELQLRTVLHLLQRQGSGSDHLSPREAGARRRSACVRTDRWGQQRFDLNEHRPCRWRCSNASVSVETGLQRAGQHGRDYGVAYSPAPALSAIIAVVSARPGH